VPVAVAVGDFNGDARPDLAVVNNGSNTVSILLNNGAWPGAGAAPVGSRSPGANPRPRTPTAAPDLVAEAVARLAPSVATLPRPGATRPLVRDGQSLLTRGEPVIEAILQTDGNLVLYGPANDDGSAHPLWASNTAGYWWTRSRSRTTATS
jgi:hypothetical protein